jgi:hypothetical protein
VKAMMGRAKWAAAVVLAAAFPCAGGPAFAAPGAVLVKPLHSPPGKIVYPRLVAGVSVGVKRAVNRALAAQEKADRNQQADCLDQIRTAGQKPEADSFSETVAVAYVSARYLSLDVRQSYFCATAYPTAGAPSPFTLDLTTGKPLDWNAVFKPGFLPRDGAIVSSTVIKLYRARFAAPPDIAACKDVIADDQSFEDGVDLWLDAAKGGLVVQPDFPHVIAACAVPIAFGAKDLAPYADAAFVSDLAAAGRASKR